MSAIGFLIRLCEEPPLRLLVRTGVKRLPLDVRTIERWDAVDRPHYLSGILAAAELARSSGIDSIYAIEFGVAGGRGLLAMQAYAAMVQQRSGVQVKVVGFDTGIGLPSTTGDYRDHPDQWMAGDYPMNEPWLRERLLPGTELILGDVNETVPDFVMRQAAPLGFLAMDLDLYSSTKAALRILTLPGSQRLRRVILYFDDTCQPQSHSFAGERLAINEFNREHDDLKLDQWHSVHDRIFRDADWIPKMYVAHDLSAISAFHAERAVQTLF